MRFRTLTTTASMTILACVAAPSEAGLFRRQTPPCRAAAAPTPTYQAATVSMPAYQAPAPALSALDAVNRLRAAYGRPPLAWDAALASYAARNTGVHAPGSSGGAAQCWAGVSDPIAAVGMWARSPAHLSIILSATTAVGVSPCSTGCTLNAR